MKAIVLIFFLSCTCAAQSGLAQSLPRSQECNTAAALNGDASGIVARVKRSKANKALTARAGDRYNVLDYGADPAGVADSASQLQTLASSVATIDSTIYFPSGTYFLSVPVNVTDKTTIETGAGVVFKCSFPNTVNDLTVFRGVGQAGASIQRISGGDQNNWTLYASQTLTPTKGAFAYEKAAIYAVARTFDASDVDFTNSGFDVVTKYHDAVGGDIRGLIADGNGNGRVWGIVAGAYAGSATNTDGQMQGIEVDMHSDVPGIPQSEYNRFNTKIGAGIYNFGTKQTTAGVLIGTAGQAFFDGITVQKNAVSRYAFQVIDLSIYPAKVPFSVDPSGNTTVNTITLGQANYANLPVPIFAGRELFCIDCRKPGERSGAGTGMLVFDDGHNHWVSTAGTIAAN